MRSRRGDMGNGTRLVMGLVEGGFKLSTFGVKNPLGEPPFVEFTRGVGTCSPKTLSALSLLRSALETQVPKNRRGITSFPVGLVGFLEVTQDDDADEYIRIIDSVTDDAGEVTLRRENTPQVVMNAIEFLWQAIEKDTEERPQ